MSKKPKPLNTVIKQVCKQYKDIGNDTRKHADDVDIDAFLKQESEFKARLDKQKE